MLGSPVDRRIPVITVTEPARTKILELLASEGRQGLAVRFAVDGRGPVTFRYQLGFVGPEEKRADDTVVEAGGFEVWVDPASAADLQGATLDYVESLSESGFKIENPNSPWQDPLAREVARVLEQEINPSVAQHGGAVSLLDVKDGVVYISMGGGCQGCGLASVTLRQGIEVRLKQAVPGVREIVDTTDHAGGTNPYYTSGEGQSPVR
jgi:Fe/S biogenesis protein NfuA